MSTIFQLRTPGLTKSYYDDVRKLQSLLIGDQWFRKGFCIRWQKQEEEGLHFWGGCPWYRQPNSYFSNLTNNSTN